MSSLEMIPGDLLHSLNHPPHGAASRVRLVPSVRQVRMLTALAVLMVVCLCSCRTLRQQSQTAENVINCRQMTRDGIEACERGRHEQARRLFEQAIVTNPLDANAHREYADYLWQQGDEQAAIAQMTEAHQLANNDVMTITRLGQMNIQLGDLSQAEQFAERAIAADSKSAPAWTLRGDVWRRQGKDESALSCYHRALDHDPSLSRVRIEVAQIYHNWNQPRRTLATIDGNSDPLSGGNLAVPSTPAASSIRQITLRSQALIQLGREAEAIEQIGIALDRGGPNAELLYLMAMAEAESGNTANAQLAARRALDLNPEHSSTRALLARLQAAPTGSPRQLR